MSIYFSHPLNLVKRLVNGIPTNPGIAQIPNDKIICLRGRKFRIFQINTSYPIALLFQSFYQACPEPAEGWLPIKPPAPQTSAFFISTPY